MKGLDMIADVNTLLRLKVKNYGIEKARNKYDDYMIIRFHENLRLMI